MLIVSGEMVSSSVDYITLTMTQNSDGPNRLTDMWAEHGRREEAKPAYWGGYKGMADQSMRLGSRKRKEQTDTILIASGSRANELVIAEREELLATRCTRLDTEVTLKLRDVDANLARKHYDVMSADAGYKKAMVGRRHISMLESETGQTLYVGERKSKGLLLRMYDKSGESGMARGETWRFEVEHKRLTAKSALEALLESEDLNSAIASDVAFEFEKSAGVLIPLDVYDEKVLQEMQRESKTGGRMRWIRTCVRPAVVDLVNQGQIDEVIEALGLSWVTEPSNVRVRLANEATRSAIYTQI